MSSGCELVLVQPDDMRGRIPIAHMRHLYRVDEDEKRLGKLPPREHETLRATNERMIDKGPARFHVKPS
ncbi:MAG: AAA family ATPase, partial [Aquabacterium sp.]|nr:AAA family ATPase [Aquabacterium sp.]